MNMNLADVSLALNRFVSSENLDRGYKCEKCGGLGRGGLGCPPPLVLESPGGVGGWGRSGGMYSDVSNGDP